MNPYAYTEEEIPPYNVYEQESLGNLALNFMVSGALAVLILSLTFAILSIAITVFAQMRIYLALLGY